MCNHKNYILLFILVVVLLTTNSLYAQFKVGGFVIDSIGNPIKDVTIRMNGIRDTLLSVTNQNGYYRFNLPKSVEKISLTYSMIGYQAQSKVFNKNDFDDSMFLPSVILKKSLFNIQGITIIKIIPMVINGDTIQYNMGAFDFENRSLLEDGLKRLPGFQVSKDGKVYYNGYNIKKVKVNNTDFFGGDIITATKNLPVDYIKNIQLIELNTNKEGTETGIVDNQEVEKILNINLKDDRKILHFGQLTIGSGTNSRYLGSFGINRFNDGNEFSLLGSVNNTNTNLFSYGDLFGGKRNSKTLDIDEFIDPADGINTTSSIGVNMAKKIGSNSRLSTSYNFVYKSTLLDGFSNLKSTYVGNIITKNETFDEIHDDYNHRLKFLLDSKFENQDILKVEGNFSLNKTNIINTKSIILSNSQVTNTGTNIDSTDQLLPMGDLEFTYAKYFKNKDRKLVGKFSLKGSRLSSNEYVDEQYSDRYGNETELNHQFIDLINYNDAKNLSISFVEPFMNYGVFEFKYEFDHNNHDVNRYVYDWMNNTIGEGIDSLTVDYNYAFNSNKMGIIYQYIPSKRIKFNLGFAVQPIKMNGSVLNDTLSYYYDNINLVPSTNFTYKLSNNVEVQLSYRGKNFQPSFFQIAPVRNNTNSRNIVVGNPSLKSEFSHSFLSSLRAYLPTHMQYLETSFAFNKIKDKIVNDKKPIDNSTVQQTTFQNADGYYDWKWNYVFNSPLFNDNWIIELDGDLNYYNNISFIQDRRRVTRQLIFNQSIQIKYSLNDYLESIFNTKYMHSRASYDVPSRAVINVESMFMGLGAKGYVKDNISLGFEMSKRYNDGYINRFMNVNQTMMNAFFEYTFLHNRTALLRFQAYDIFDQNTHMGIYSEYIGNDVYEERKNRLGRYFMLSLNIRLQK